MIDHSFIRMKIHFFLLSFFHFITECVSESDFQLFDFSTFRLFDFPTF